MAEMMKAVVSYAPYDNRYEDYPKPAAGAGEIVLKVKGCGICAGDVKAYHGGIRIWGTSPENRYIEAPCIGGHEFYGEVVELGEGVEGYEVGDVLVSEQVIPCGECEFCKKGIYWMCTRSAVFGFKQYANGGFAEYVRLDKNCINHKVPRGFTPEQAVLIEPIACGMHAVERAQIQHSDVVVIAGLGAIGTSMVNIASLALPKMVIGIDVKDNRLEMGKKYGADVVLNPTKCNVAEDSLKNLGRYVQMGVFAEEVKADWNTIGDGKELTIIGSHLSALTYDSVIKGIADGEIKTEGLISHKFKLADWEEAFQTTEADDAMKIMLEP